jgi:hypothetical protein
MDESGKKESFKSHNLHIVAFRYDQRMLVCLAHGKV